MIYHLRPLLIALAVSLSADLYAQRPNVLFIAVDDLNDVAAGLNGQIKADTPFIDALAKRGTLFTNAHCASPPCNPSPVSVMTGDSPTTSGVYLNNQDWRDCSRLKGLTTLPAHFRDHGYEVLGGGKLYHADNSEELYDHRNDHEELTNLANDSLYADVKRRLAASIPKTYAPMDPESKSRK